VITNYNASPSEVPLETELAISGTFVDDLNHSTNIICSYYITDQNGIKLYRMSDTRTDLQGNFFQKLRLTEPRFQRGEDYNALTICDQANATKQFLLGQREAVYHSTLWEFKWLTDPSNINPVFWFGLFAALLVVAILGIYYLSHKLNRKWG
jgi:hypothetical protein